MLASRGMHHAFRLLGQVSKGQFGHHPSRSIHVLRGRSTGSSSRNVLGRAQEVILKFLFGNNVPSTSKAASFSSRAVGNRITPIRNQLSFPARQFLARNAVGGPPFLPRPPHMPRSVVQVGLGTARNFSTARPLFQAFVENVPVATRALYEMDLDVQKRKKKRLGRKLKENVKKGKKSQSLKSPKLAFDDYFATLPPTEVSTLLVVPLAPVDEPVNSSSPADESISLLDGSALLAAHNAHSSHALRISSLFLRLDQGKVWDKGAHYEAFGVEDLWPDGSRPSGSSALCTSLRIVFDGWTEQQVRSVIGDAGKEWCVLREIRKTQGTPQSVDTTRCTTPASFEFEYAGSDEVSSTGQEFIMPRLEFSSSFIEGTRTPFEDMAPLHEDSAWSSPILASPSLVESELGSEFSELEEDALRWVDEGAAADSVDHSEFRTMTRGQEIMMPF